MDNVVCYGQIKALTLNDNSVRAGIEIELERGLIDDLMDLKRRGQFRLVLEPFQKRLGEAAMAEIRAFADLHPYVRMEIPASGCDHPPEARWITGGEAGELVNACRECGEVLGGPVELVPHPDDAGMTTPAEDEAADHAKADEAEAQFDALADSSRNNRRAPATAKDKQEQDEAAARLAHTSSP